MSKFSESFYEWAFEILASNLNEEAELATQVEIAKTELVIS